MKTFETWAEENGITTFGTVLKTTESSGNGLFSSQPINKDVSIVQIPAPLVLTSKRILKSEDQFSASVHRYLMTLYDLSLEDAISFAATQNRLVITLYLIYCRFFPANDHWKPYVDVLPLLDFFKTSHVLFNPDAVTGTCLENSVCAKLRNLTREHQEINASGEGWLKKIDMDMYLWADCTFWSRAVGLGEADGESDEMALVPYFDMANHSLTESNIRWQLTDDRGLELVTTSDVKEQDQELVLFYGSKPNQELLFVHGFCIPNNPELSRLTISLMPFFDFSDQEDISKAQWLKNTGAKPVLTWLKMSGSEDTLVADGWTTESVTTLYLISLTEEDGLRFSLEGALELNGKPIQNLVELYGCTKELEILPLIQLRATMLLMQALEHQLNLNISNETTGPESLQGQVSIYRAEERDILQNALVQLAGLQEKLSNDKLVLSYLMNQD
ncbi:hypothetical protein G6F56_009738 [Rhizopus delemar]|nr:hypothetical protein G6F56_009738 [Rhizopus delemar]